MAQNEKLGIEIEIDLAGAKKQLEDLNKVLANVGKGFKTEDFAKSFANAFAKAFSDLEKRAEKSVEKISKIAKKLAEQGANGLSEPKGAQTALNEATFNKKLASASKTIREYSQTVLNADGVLVSFVKHQEQLATAAKKASQELVAQQRSQAKGFEYVNPKDKSQGYIRSSYIKDQSIAWDQAHIERAAKVSKAAAEAEKERAKAHRDAGRAAADAGKNTNILNLSLTKLAARITEFYSIREVILGIGNGMRQAAHESLLFNQALHDTAAISNASQENMNKFGQATLAIARNSKSSLTEINQMMNLLAQSGVSAENVPSVGKVVNMFASGTGSSMENAVRVLTTTMNVWEYSAEDAAIAANVLAAGLNSAKIEVNELSTVFNYLAPMARQVGMSLEETTGAIATLSQAGIKASTIGTSLSELLNKLMAPTPKLQKMFKDANIGLEELNPRVNSLIDILNRVKKAGDALPMERVYSSFGPRAGRALEALLTLGPEYLKVMTDNVTGTQAAFTAYMTSMDGAMAKLNVLKQSFTQAFMEIASATRGALEAAYKVVYDFLRGIQTEEGKTVLALGAIALGVTGIVYAMDNLGKAWAVLKTMNPELRALALVFTGVVTAIEIFGNRANAVTASVDRAIKDYAKSASALQRTFTGLGDAYAQASEAGILKNKMTLDAKSKIEGLVSAYPELLKYVREEVRTYEDLIGVMELVNKTRAAQAKQLLPTVNDLSARIAIQAKPYDDKVQKVEQRIQEQKDFITNHKGEGGDQARALIDALSNQRASILEDRDKSTQFLQDRMDKLLSSGGFKRVGTGANGAPVYGIVESVTTNLREGNKPWVPSTSAGGPKAVNMSEVLRKNQNETVRLIQDYEVKTIENTISELQTQLSDANKKGDTGTFKNLTTQLEQKFQELRDKKEARFIEDYWSRQAQDIGATYKDGNFTFEGEHAKKNEASFLANKTDFDFDLGKRLGAFRKDLDVEQQKNQTKLPDQKVDLLSLEADKKEKVLNFELKAFQQRAEIQKEETYTASEIYKIEESILLKTREIGAQKVKNLEADNETIEKWLKQNEGNEALRQKAEEYRGTLERNKETIKEQNLLLEAQRKQYDRLADHSFWSNFEKGAGSTWKGLSDIDKLSQGLGSDLTNSAFNGLTGTLSNTLSTFTMPDSDAIDSIKSRINELNIQKAEIQAEIASITSKGEFMTGADKTRLNEQAAGLEAVNASLREQEKLLDKQKNAWSRFKDGLAETMKMILKTLQEYIIKLMVVKMVEGVAQGYGGWAAGGGWGSNVEGSSNFVGPSRMATGGLIPNSAGVPGKDSVPILGMPGEFIIPTDSVNKYGVAFFEKLRAKKFAEGGLVGGSSSKPTSSTEKTSQSLTIVNVLPDQIPQTTDDQIINVISYDMAKKGQTYRAVKYAANN